MKESVKKFAENKTSKINVDPVKAKRTHLYPAETSPAQIISGPIQGDVQRVEVSRLPVEELAQVEADECRVDHRPEGVAVSLNGGHGERDDEERPAEHPHPAVCPLLHVHVEEHRQTERERERERERDEEKKQYLINWMHLNCKQGGSVFLSALNSLELT